MNYIGIFAIILLGLCRWSCAETNTMDHKQQLAHNFVRAARSKRAINIIETVEQATDVVMRELRPIMEKYNMEPFYVGNQSQKIAFVADLNLYHIEVVNLTTIRRQGNLTIIDDDVARTMTIQLKLTFDDLQVLCGYSAGVFPLYSNGKIIAKIPIISIMMTFKIDFSEVDIELLDFQLDMNSKSISVHFSDNIEAFLLNLITAPIMAIFSGIILNIIQGPVKDQINAALDQVNIALKTTLESIGERPETN